MRKPSARARLHIWEGGGKTFVSRSNCRWRISSIILTFLNCLLQVKTTVRNHLEIYLARRCWFLDGLQNAILETLNHPWPWVRGRSCSGLTPRNASCGGDLSPPPRRHNRPDGQIFQRVGVFVLGWAQSSKSSSRRHSTWPSTADQARQLCESSCVFCTVYCVIALLGHFLLSLLLLNNAILQGFLQNFLVWSHFALCFVSRFFVLFISRKSALCVVQCWTNVCCAHLVQPTPRCISLSNLAPRIAFLNGSSRCVFPDSV